MTLAPHSLPRQAAPRETIASADVAVLAEPAVYPGLAALLNSLVRHGFSGNIWVGLRGDLPRWAARGQRDGLPLQLGSCRVHFIQLTTFRPFTYYKPTFVRQVLDDLSPACDAVVYIDTDIVVNRQWPFFTAWLGYGLAIVEDLPLHQVRETHPRRLALIEWLESLDFPLQRTLSAYFNAGFIGLPRSLSSFLEPWIALVDAAEAALSLRSAVSHYIPAGTSVPSCARLPSRVEGILRSMFHNDQEALNMALMATSTPISAYGPDGMGFTSDSWNIPLAHAVGPAKPWNKRFLYRLARFGEAPSIVDVVWWRYAAGPLPAVSRLRQASALADIRTARLCARIL